jgi:hypothetical protein
MVVGYLGVQLGLFLWVRFFLPWHWLISWDTTDMKFLQLWLVGGFNPLKNMKVSWDDDIPNIWKFIKHVPNHQPVMV